MRKFLPFVCLVIFANLATAQTTVKIGNAKPFVVEFGKDAVLSAAAGDLIVVSVESKGAIDFRYSARDFPPERSYKSDIDKKLFLTTPDGGEFVVTIIRYDEKNWQDLVIKVSGVPRPPPPPPASLEMQLKAAFAKDGPAKASELAAVCDAVVKAALLKIDALPGLYELLLVASQVGDAQPGVRSILAERIKGKHAEVAADFTLAARVLRGGPPVPPDPPVPVPDAALVKAFKAALVQDPAHERALHFKDLIDLYRQAAKSSSDPRIETFKDLNDTIREVRKKQMGEALPAVRAAVNAYLQAKITVTVTQPLDEKTRKLCETVFSEVAAALAATGG